MKKWFSVFGIILILSALTLTGCSKEKSEEIVMGFVPMRDGDKLIESVEPLAQLLSEEIGIPVRPFTATNYVGVVEGLGSGAVDFGFIPPFAYVLANSENNAQVILTALNRNGEPHYRSQFLVRKDSGIQSFEDIKGKKVAFVDPTSTSGYLFPAAHLKRLGFDLERDITYIYAGGHDKGLQLLLNGDVDVATTSVDIRVRYQNEFPTALEETKVLGYTDYIPNISVTVRGDMEEELVEKIKRALLNIAKSEEGGELLKTLFNMYGFVEAKDSDYDIIRETARLMNIDLKNSN
ncbi:phosphonate transport system substrate-binding protein [Anaerobranca californiensis DSM 14826]|jgi:phosphonate transport system substrate-binding protein|uniref:Phosphonate transport system substrate-binding protein n=1 Tax=Anaerobranca californiensis DSM 14826 TaxID=1120989 RepID=A0A1M6MLD9_9FIRM|nr:phosphate/phosphite/phosphonate ABC transporter substrate-binding protein [Anaerobranca californiensis]SHJ84288.1 phosphonate transport system substrate-binding protein [Anaerobranca californiensis DSM 14826]